ncbi:hypothetical protein P5673_022940 [Acropora cervicornis]|uniref:Uncharacterized protein n=1 Tax=Acropora cervicornis TaxID=6130 RepID=A0AAD9Q5S2_ACRCE|nr:hypothetical protein P5673_022940 [Acropora cervicornis]
MADVTLESLTLAKPRILDRPAAVMLEVTKQEMPFESIRCSVHLPRCRKLFHAALSALIPRMKKSTTRDQQH